MKRFIFALLCTLVLTLGCEDAGDALLSPVVTVKVGVNDNPEVVRYAGTGELLLLSSKVRKLTRFRASDGDVREVSGHVLTPAEVTKESELTNFAVDAASRVAFVTQTLIDENGAGEQIACRGKLLAVSIAEADFGTIVSEVETGAMPDGVAISADGQWIVVANERDGDDNWGKCLLSDATDGSISVLKFEERQLVKQFDIRLQQLGANKAHREPEYVAIAGDNDTVMVTLQDSHEVAIFSIAAVAAMGKASLDDSVLNIVALPADALGRGAWPDGVLAWPLRSRSPIFAIAGEWNDVLYFVDGEGNVISTKVIETSEIPANYPRVDEAGSSYKVGLEDVGRDAGSKVAPEGIACQGRQIATANEKSASVSVIFRPESLSQ